MDRSALPGDLQDLIGYRFHNEKILEDAMTSRAGEPPAPKKGCTEPLAAVGDAVLDAVVTCRLYEEMTQDTGEVTVSKPEDVKRDRTRSFAEKHQLIRYVQGGRVTTQEEVWMTGIRQNDMVTETLVGAVFVDAERHGGNGFIVVKKVLDDLGYF
jgi:dsRNA-specific ribonuclease